MSALLNVTQNQSLRKRFSWRDGIRAYAITASASKTVRNNRVRRESACLSIPLPVSTKSLLDSLRCLHHLIRHVDMPNEPFSPRPIAIPVVI